jgi:hypothetical protein
MSDEAKPHDLDDLVKEIVKNARADRKRLEKVCDSVVGIAENTDDPLALLGLSEQMSLITDSLTKTNAQLVEIAKIRAKERAPKEEKHDESVFDEIESSMHT